MTFTVIQMVSAASKAPAARKKNVSLRPRNASVNTIAAAKISAPSCERASTIIMVSTKAVPPELRRAYWQTASVGQNSACASHISVGKPKTIGQSRAVEPQA